mgnify:CR=1 FL=1
MSPFDWQEGIGHRAQYVESRLAAGVPVVAFSHAEGILIGTYRSQARKVYEIYDRLAYAGIGLQSDIEAVRVAAVDFAHQEGYQRSQDDVTIQRVISVLSAPVKRAFSDFQMSPLVIKCLFAEVEDTVEKDRYYTIDYDGDYAVCRNCSVIAGTDEARDKLSDLLDRKAMAKSTPEKAATLMDAALHKLLTEADYPMEDLRFEAAILARAPGLRRRFRLLTVND